MNKTIAQRELRNENARVMDGQKLYCLRIKLPSLLRGLKQQNTDRTEKPATSLR